MPESKLEVLIHAKDEASKTLEGINGKIQGMSGQLKTMGVGMLAVGGAITATAFASIKSFADMGDEVQKMSLRTGFSVEALSELRHAANLCGTDLAAMETGIKKMSSCIYDASMGLKTSTDSLDALGLSVEDLVGLKPEDQFFKIAHAMGSLEDATQRSALAQDVFGRAGTQLLPLFAQGADGMNKLRREAHDLGIVFDQEAANSAANLKDGLTRVNGAVDGLKFAVAEHLIPILIPLIEKVTEIIGRVRKWADEHPELFRVMTIVTVAIGALLVPLGGLLLILPMLSTLVLGFTAVCSPWLLIIGVLILALAALGYASYKLYQEWDNVVKDMTKLWTTFQENTVKAWNAVVEYFVKVYESIRTVFAAIGEAIWKPIEYAIKTAQENVVKAWNSIIEYFVKVYESIRAVFVAIGEAIWRPIETAIKTAQENVVTAWNSIIEYFVKVYESIRTVFAAIGEAIWKPIEYAIKTAIAWIDAIIARITALFSFITGLGGRGASVSGGGEEKGVIGGTRYYYPEGPPYFEHGGVMPYTGLAFLHEGERVLPANAPIMIHNIIKLDGRVIGENVVEYIAGETSLQGY